MPCSVKSINCDGAAICGDVVAAVAAGVVVVFPIRQQAVQSLVSFVTIFATAVETDGGPTTENHTETHPDSQPLCGQLRLGLCLH